MSKNISVRYKKMGLSDMFFDLREKSKRNKLFIFTAHENMKHGSKGVGI